MNHVNTNQIWVVITLFRLIWHQTEFRLVPNQSEKRNKQSYQLYFMKCSTVLGLFEISFFSVFGIWLCRNVENLPIEKYSCSLRSLNSFPKLTSINFENCRSCNILVSYLQPWQLWRYKTRKARTVGSEISDFFSLLFEFFRSKGGPRDTSRESDRKL